MQDGRPSVVKSILPRERGAVQRSAFGYYTFPLRFLILVIQAQQCTLFHVRYNLANFFRNRETILERFTCKVVDHGVQVTGSVPLTRPGLPQVWYAPSAE